jgi:hypothetical protein
VCTLTVLAAILAGADRTFGAPAVPEQAQPLISGGAKSVGLSPPEVVEEIAKRRGNRTKSLMLKDDHHVPCPRLTALIYAANDRIGMVIPNASTLGVAVEERFELELNTVNYISHNESCRLTAKVKKYLVRGHDETEIPLVDPMALAAALSDKVSTSNSPKSHRGETNSRGPVHVEGNKATFNIQDVDPNRIGTTEVSTKFSSPDPALSFSGIVWFGAKNFSFYIANAASDLSIQARPSTLAKGYEVDLSNPQARISFTIIKEVHVGNAWTTEFGE